MVTQNSQNVAKMLDLFFSLWHEICGIYGNRNSQNVAQIQLECTVCE